MNISLKRRYLLAFTIFLNIFFSTNILAISKADREAATYDSSWYDDSVTDTNPCGSGAAPSTSTSTTVAPGSKLFFIGDSITYGMTKVGGLLDKAQAGGYAVATNFTVSGSNSAPRVSGPAVEATGGITIAGTIPNLAEHAVDIAHAGAIIIGLGTNREQTDFPTAVTTLVTNIRSTPGFAPTTPIFWINTYYNSPSRSTPYTEVNSEISTAAAANGINIIDIASAAIADPSLAPDGGDGVHYSPAGYQTRSAFIISHLSLTAAAAGATPAPAPGGYDPTSLSYPNFPDEALIAANIEDHIRHVYSSSPWLAIPNFGTFLLNETKARGINPMILMASGQQESSYGNSNNARVNNNFFGMEKSNGDYIHFDTPELGMTGFMDQLKRNIIDKSNPKYAAVTDMYEYFSVHQTGGIHYPGDGLSLGDPHSPSQYISWDTQYNPGTYWHTAASVITAITGITISPEIPPPGGGVTLTSCVSKPANGTAAQYISDCSVNDGNAAIACTAINQLQGIPYSQPQRAAPTDPHPAFLDCSAFTGMAVYRTFGVNLGGICSLNYLNNPNFVQINTQDIQPGDLVGKGTQCGDDSRGISGHIGVVVSYNSATKKLITVEASSSSHPSGLRGIGGPDGYNVGLVADGNGTYEWAVRYIGTKVLQPGAL